MVQHAVNQDIRWASKHINVQPVEEFLQIHGLVLGQAVGIVEHEVIEDWEVLGHAGQLLGRQKQFIAGTPLVPAAALVGRDAWQSFCMVGLVAGEQSLAHKHLDLFHRHWAVLAG